MASHRKMARSGYFITLTEVGLIAVHNYVFKNAPHLPNQRQVLRFSSATLCHVMSLINKHLEIGKAKSQVWMATIKCVYIESIKWNTVTHCLRKREGPTLEGCLCSLH